MKNPELLLHQELNTGDHLWVAPLRKGDHRLIHWREHPTPGVLQVETLESNTGLIHVRIYLPKTETQIPTVVIGHPAVVSVYGWRDQKPVHPLRHDVQASIPETNLVWPIDFESLHVDQAINGGKTSYFVRPSSFLLTDVEFARLLDTPVKVKRFTNVFDGSVFTHITAPDEWEDAFPTLGIHGLVTTNSASYVAAHPEYTFGGIVDTNPMLY